MFKLTLEDLEPHQLVATNEDHLYALRCLAEELYKNGGTIHEKDMRNLIGILRSLQITPDPEKREKTRHRHKARRRKHKKTA